MTAKENRGVKNSVFVDLYYEDESAEQNEIELYNALHKEPLPPGTKIQKIRVDNVLYMNFKNDISFGAAGKVLVFGEHQSTINENMPLRCLMYIGRAYEQIVSTEERYKRNKVLIPKPEFYTFYNGKKKWAKERTLRLSDSYLIPDEENFLELSVKVININPEENHEILKKCHVLKQYSEFIETVRAYEKKGVQNPYEQAIKECIERGILSDYLKKKGSEVVNMLIAEYDYDMDIAVQRKEAWEDGEKSGEERGEKRGIEQGRMNMIMDFLANGGTEENVKKMLKATPEEIQRAKKMLE